MVLEWNRQLREPGSCTSPDAVRYAGLA